MWVKFVAALAVIRVGLAGAEWIDFGTGVSEAKVTILEQNNSHTTFEVLIPGIEIEPVEIAGRASVRFSVPGCMQGGLTVGSPEFPRLPIALAVPKGAGLSVEVLERESMTLDIGPVFPQQGDEERPVAAQR
jgi:hypothetical protein